MTWTHDAPTKPGVYWWRNTPRGFRTTVDVAEFRGKKNHLVVYGLEFNPRFPTSIEKTHMMYPTCQWSSTPIPEPKDPQ